LGRERAGAFHLSPMEKLGEEAAETGRHDLLGAVEAVDAELELVEPIVPAGGAHRLLTADRRHDLRDGEIALGGNGNAFDVRIFVDQPSQQAGRYLAARAVDHFAAMVVAEEDGK